jgi:hypothetical protein
MQVRRIRAKLAAAAVLILGLSDMLMAQDDGQCCTWYAQVGARIQTWQDVFGPLEPFLPPGELF